MIVKSLFRYFFIILCLATQSNAQQFTLYTDIENTFAKGQITSSGCSWGDFNNDGWQDLLITNLANDTLYRNNGDGTFTPLNNSVVSTDGNASSGGVWGDYDNDGFIDLFVPTAKNNLLYRNNGDETFTRITGGGIADDPVPEFFVGTNSSAWGDYNGDGYLDLYVTHVAGKNCLYKNNGNGSFTKITEGIIVNDSFSSRDCAWIDYDNDCDLDLFVTTSASGRLYRNDGSNGFRQLAKWLENDMITTSSWGDFDNDGFFDLLIGYGNSQGGVNLYKNNSGETFTKVSNSGLFTHNGLGARGSGWGDFDNDGFLDVFFTNVQGSGGANLFRNNGNGTFSKAGGINFSGSGPEPTSWCDYNNDGYLDLLILTHWGDTKNHLYTNYGGGNHWLEVEVNSTNGLIIGTKIQVSYRSQSRVISSVSGHHAQSPSVAHFGLGDSSEVDVTITWPSGTIQRMEKVAANQKIIVDETGLSPAFRNIDLGPDQIICDETSTVLQAPEGFDSYRWNNNSQSPAITVNQSGSYFIDAKIGCWSTRDSINVRFESTPDLALGADISTCDEQPVRINPDVGGVAYLWNTGATEAQYTITESGTYWLKIENECGSDTDTIQAEFVKPSEKLELGGDSVLCVGQPLQLNVPGEYQDVRWNTGSTRHVLDVTTDGFYRVTAQLKDCVYSDSVEIKFDNEPSSIFASEEMLVCALTDIKLTAGPDFDTYLWQNGSTDSTMTVQSTGKYSVTVTNACGTFDDTIDVKLFGPRSVFIPNIITPNWDARNDSFIVDDVITGSQLEVFNRWGKQVFFSANYQNEWVAEGLDSGTYYFLITEDHCSTKLSGWIHVVH